MYAVPPGTGNHPADKLQQGMHKYPIAVLGPDMRRLRTAGLPLGMREIQIILPQHAALQGTAAESA